MPSESSVPSPIAPRPSPTPRGVYFLGNDRVLNFGIAAFESLRATNPDLAAYLLPFNDDLARTREICARYNITVIDDPVLRALHEIAEEFWDEKHRDHAMLKKFYAFSGPAQIFLYADCDVVFLENLHPLFDQFEQANLQFLSFDTCSDYVYNRGPLRAQLEAAHITRSFNAGVFISRSGLTTFPEIQRFFREHKAIRSEFQDLRDQAMLNYYVDFHRWRHLNLAELDPTYCPTNNGRHAPIRADADGVHTLRAKHSPHFGKRFNHLHWNGLKLPTVLPNHLHYRRHRNRPEPFSTRLRLNLQNLWQGRSALCASLGESFGLFTHRALRRLGLRR